MQAGCSVTAYNRLKKLQVCNRGWWLVDIGGYWLDITMISIGCVAALALVGFLPVVHIARLYYLRKYDCMTLCITCSYNV